jgi:hypothetical protein
LEILLAARAEQQRLPRRSLAHHLCSAAHSKEHRQARSARSRHRLESLGKGTRLKELHWEQPRKKWG